MRNFKMHLKNFLKMTKTNNILIKLALILFLFANPAKALDNSDLVIGEKDSKITIEIYSSLTCPYCAKLHLEVLPGLIKNFTKNGEAKIILKDFPLDLSALNAAKISRCVSKEKMVKFLDRIYLKQSEWTRGKNILEINEKIKKISSNFGIGDQKFNSCLADEKNEELILQSRIEGSKKHSINSTPTIIINNKKYTGNYTVEDISKYIEKIK